MLAASTEVMQGYQLYRCTARPASCHCNFRSAPSVIKLLLGMLLSPSSTPTRCMLFVSMSRAHLWAHVHTPPVHPPNRLSDGHNQSMLRSWRHMSAACHQMGCCFHSCCTSPGHRSHIGRSRWCRSTPHDRPSSVLAPGRGGGQAVGLHFVELVS